MNQSVDVRTRILKEATRLFAARGVSGASIQSIAQAAGITRPTLVYHFGSKDGLRVAVLESMVQHWRVELPRLMVAATSGGPRLDALLAALFEFFRSDPNLARLLIREMLDRPAEMGALLREHLQPWTRLLTEAIRAGQGSGALQPELDPESFTVLIISSAMAVVAVGEHAGALIAPEPSVDAQQAELLRVAKASLLTPRASAPPSSSKTVES